VLDVFGGGQLGAPNEQQHETLVADLAALALAGGGRIESPTGASLGASYYADVRFMQIGALEPHGAHGGKLRRWLYLHPPSTASFDVLVPDNAVFRAGLGIDPVTWEAPVGDGVRFIVSARTLSDGGQPAAVLLDRHVNPRARTEERGWNEVEIGLDRFAGQRIELTLRTEPVDELSFDWAGWGNPIIHVRTDS
jgi:hypothetical protein